MNKFKVIFSCLLIQLLFFGTMSHVAAGDKDWWYKGPYFIYPNDPTKMIVMAETHVGVDDDSDHRTLELYDFSDSCAPPHTETPWGPAYIFGKDYSYTKMEVNNGWDRRLWKVEISDLVPNCRYRVKFKFRKTGASEWSKVYGSFWSAPPRNSAEELSFVAVGDTQYMEQYEGNIKDVAEAMRHTTRYQASSEPEVGFIIHVGDIVNNGGYDLDALAGGHDEWKPFFQLTEVYNLLRRRPIFTVAGNHDIQNEDGGFISGSGWNYSKYFPYRNTRNRYQQYYSRRYGKILLIGLNTFPSPEKPWRCAPNENFRPEDQDGSGQYEWLEKKLRENDEENQPWVVVMMHAPIDSCGSDTDAGKFLKPLFKEYGVDLVLAGHDHEYKHSVEGGITYITTGGGGPSQDATPHFVYFTTRGSEMTGKMVDKNNNVKETFTVVNRTREPVEATACNKPYPSGDYIWETDSGKWSDWGEWGEMEECPMGSLAYAYSMKVEQNQGSGDDTAVNGIKLYCRDRCGIDVATITSTVQQWGTWGDKSACLPSIEQATDGMWLQSTSKIRESDQGSGDDTAVDSVKFKCSDGQQEIKGSNGIEDWGEWEEYVSCPPGQAICGIQTHVEPAQDDGEDDTALNGVIYKCCKIE